MLCSHSALVQVLFDHMGCMKRYNSVQEILKEFYELRLHYYKLRKDWLVGSLGAEAAKLSNQARFVLEKIEGKISIGENVPKDVSHSPSPATAGPRRLTCLFSCHQRTNPSGT